MQLSDTGVGDELTVVGQVTRGVIGHTARLESDVPAHMALRRNSDLSVGRSPGYDALVDLALDG